jgi:hypothetical protein
MFVLFSVIVFVAENIRMKMFIWVTSLLNYLLNQLGGLGFSTAQCRFGKMPVISLLSSWNQACQHCKLSAAL